MSDVLNPTFTVKAGGFEFIFRVPTPLDKARLGTREASIRRIIDPTSSGWADGLDEGTFYLIRGMAVLEQFLEKSDAKWAFSESSRTPNGPAEVRVDITRFPAGTEEVITEVGREFQAALDRFHVRGAVHSKPAVPEAVAGGVDPVAL